MIERSRIEAIDIDKEHAKEILWKQVLMNKRTLFRK